MNPRRNFGDSHHNSGIMVTVTEIMPAEMIYEEIID